MDRSRIAEKLKAFLETECKVAVPAADARLRIDSFNMMLIITFAGEEFGVALDMNNLDFDALTSLDAFVELIANKARAA
jgi:acyl carrier protein